MGDSMKSAFAPTVATWAVYCNYDPRRPDTPPTLGTWQVSAIAIMEDESTGTLYLENQICDGDGMFSGAEMSNFLGFDDTKTPDIDDWAEQIAYFVQIEQRKLEAIKAQKGQP